MQLLLPQSEMRSEFGDFIKSAAFENLSNKPHPQI